jgi:DNA-binding XRE family transcriptional regulator
MPKAKRKWDEGRFFLLEEAAFEPESGQVRVRFVNGDSVEVPCLTLWQDRPQKPLWERLRVDAKTRGSLLVPTRQGTREEIPGDVIRMMSDAAYRAYIVRLASLWAQRVGRHLATLRKARGLTQKVVAEAAGLGRVSLAKVETGKVEPSFSTVVKLLAAMGARIQDLPNLKAS